MTGKMIRERRKALGLTQIEVSGMLGCTSQGMLCQIELGDKPISKDIRENAETYLFSEYGNKLAFVTHELTALLHRIDSLVDHAEYRMTDSGEEYVTIVYKVNGSRVICVTADSLEAITRDVLNHL